MTFFQFEADFTDNLRCIPMVVRYKLDTCGIKIQLSHWNNLDQTEKQQLVISPCETDIEISNYRHIVHNLISKHQNQPPKDQPINPTPEWHNPHIIPHTVQTQTQKLNITLTPQQWESLTTLQRFALIKLSRSNHENHNFLPALQEFKII